MENTTWKDLRRWEKNIKYFLKKCVVNELTEIQILMKMMNREFSKQE
jgi:hypothetical protein